MFDYDEICKKRVWTKLKTEEPAHELENLLSWYFNHPSKLSEKITQHASVFAGKLWQNCSPLEKQNIAKYLVESEHQDALFLQNCKSYTLYTAQFLYEKKINLKLGVKTTIGSEHASKLIAVHPKYINDDEVIDALFLYLNKHGFEHCSLVTTVPSLEMHLENANFKTIVCLGHGTLRNKDMIFDCGPIDGQHDKVVKCWSLLLQKASHVEHLRLLYCYYGHINPDFEEEKQSEHIQYNQYKYEIDSGRVTATVCYQPRTPLPFHDESFAGMLWQDLVIKNKRSAFCLSATPMILNPLPARQPEFFASCDIDHYNLPPQQSKLSMWNDPSLPKLSMTKSITLVTPDSSKNPFSK
jgi:hypothetical protein